jgi:hypothetical protein
MLRHRLKSGRNQSSAYSLHHAGTPARTGHAAVTAPEFTVDAAIVGGCGHVGLPLGLALADRGLNITLFDVNA